MIVSCAACGRGGLHDKDHIMALTSQPLLALACTLAAGASLLLIAPVTGFREVISAKWSMIIVLLITAGSLIACSWAVADLKQSSDFGRMPSA